jgi:hypothetical protein
MNTPSSIHHRLSQWPFIRRFLLPGLLIAVTLSGCATVQPESRDEARRKVAQVAVGDVVTCTWRSGLSRTFRVTEVRDGWLIGETGSAYATDLTRLEVRGKQVDQVPGILVGLGCAYSVAYLIAHPPVFLPASGP